MESVNEINLIFNYECNSTKELKCEMKDIIEDIFKKYTLQMGLQLENLIFLYGGRSIDNYKKPLSSLISQVDKESKEMNILVYDIKISDPNTINIIFLYESETIIKKKCKKQDKVRDICYEFAKEIDINDFASIVFLYGGMELNLDKTFFQLANEYDKSCNGMTILVYKKPKPLIVNFLYDNKLDKIKCSKKDQIYSICYYYALKNKLNFENLFFYYQKDEINLLQTFNDLLNKYNNSQSIKVNETQSNDSFSELDKNDEIEITVEYCCAPKCRRKKKLIIIATSITGFICLLSMIITIIILKKIWENTDE